MAILKYYKVGSDGKIQRLRRECKSTRSQDFMSTADKQALPRPVVPVSSWLGTRTDRPAESVVSPTLSSLEPSPLPPNRAVI